MYHLVCVILLVSLNGIKTQSTNSSPTLSNNSSTQLTSTNKELTTPITTTVSKTFNNPKTTQVQATNMKQADCLISLSNTKETLLFMLIAFLMLICLFLLVIIMCLTCKHCRGFRNDKMVVLKSSESIRRSSVNGGPSETELMLKDCSSMKIEIETTPDETQKETSGAAAEVGNQASIGERENADNSTCVMADQKMEDLEKAE